MEKLIAQFRFVAVLMTGAALLDTYQNANAVAGHGLLIALAWGGAAVYAVAVLFAKPYHHVPFIGWAAVSGFLDWSLIALAIIATGMERSDLYVLYFLFVLSIALRFGLRAVIIAGVGTVAAYLSFVLATADHWSSTLHVAGPHMGYVLLFAVVSGVLAREARQQLRARIKGEAQRSAVEEVTATVSHDLRNPLAAITGLVEMLLDAAPETLSFDQRALLHRISANAQQMANLVTNLVDAELIERGQQTFRPAPVDLNVLVRQVVEAQAHLAEMKQIGLVLDLSPRVPRTDLDAGMIERVVANLLHNAVKFTPENGAIRVSTQRQENSVGIEVWNSGAHIPAAIRATMFEKFVRNADSRGVGLGLYICKSVVNLHRGTIAVRNAPGGGVAIVAEFPLTVSEARVSGPLPAWQPSRRALGQLS